MPLTPAPQQTINAPTPLPASFPSGPPFDALDYLPPAAAARWRQLLIRSSDAHAVMVPFADISELSAERTEAEQRLKRLLAPAAENGFHLRDDDRRVTEQRRLIDKLTADLKLLNERSEARAAAFRAASQPKAAVESWLRDGRPGNTVLQDFETPEVKLAKGESLMDALDKVRRRGRELKADLHRIASAPYPSSHARAKIRTEVEALAMQGTPVVSNVIEHDGTIIWPTRRVQSEVYGAERSLAFSEPHDAVALVAWLHKDALIAALYREITAESDDAAALSPIERETRTAETMGDLLDVERQEAALVWRGQAEGLPVEHRSDCDPCAILQVRLITAPRGTNGHSSPERASYNLAGGR
jgi:hypothetical protein